MKKRLQMRLFQTIKVKNKRVMILIQSRKVNKNLSLQRPRQKKYLMKGQVTNPIKIKIKRW